MTALLSLTPLLQEGRFQKRYEDAESLLQNSLKMEQKLFGDEKSNIAFNQWQLGILYQDQGRNKEAETLYRKALVNSEKELGSSHPNTQMIRSSLESLTQ